jgi:hypothetical protein
MRASQTSCNKDATRMMERHAEREREVWGQNGGGGGGGGGGFNHKCKTQPKKNETLKDQGLGFKED